MKNLSSLIMPMSNGGSLAEMQHSSCDGHGTDACMHMHIAGPVLVELGTRANTAWAPQNSASLAGLPTHARTGQRGDSEAAAALGRRARAAALLVPVVGRYRTRQTLPTLPARARGTFATRHRAEQQRHSSLPLHPMRGFLTHAVHRHAERVGMWTGCDSPGACG